jgi:hypothetical protein
VEWLKWWSASLAIVRPRIQTSVPPKNIQARRKDFNCVPPKRSNKKVEDIRYVCPHLVIMQGRCASKHPMVLHMHAVFVLI